MYAPAHFREDRVPVLHGAMEAAGLATLVTFGAGGLDASHVPMLLDRAAGPLGTLRGHIARANPQWRDAGAGVPALALFLGPSAYVSPAWYPTKQRTGKVVPTWNYVTVHAHGRAEFFDDEERLRRLVASLTDAREAERAQPWSVDDAPDDYIRAQLGGIVGFELRIERLEGKWKLSQNRPPEDRAGVIDGLEREGDAGGGAIADAMRGGRGGTGGG